MPTGEHVAERRSRRATADDAGTRASTWRQSRQDDEKHSRENGRTIKQPKARGPRR
jgi:hypothetical protein